MDASRISRCAASFAGDTGYGCAHEHWTLDREAIAVVYRPQSPGGGRRREAHLRGAGPVREAGAGTTYCGVMFDACRPFGPRFTS